MKRKVLSSSLWHAWDTWAWMEAAPGEIHNGHQEAFPYREGGQTLEEASLRGCQCPKPGSVRESFGQCLQQDASALGQA